jgi:hypothetical protein
MFKVQVFFLILFPTFQHHKFQHFVPFHELDFLDSIVVVDSFVVEFVCNIVVELNIVDTSNFVVPLHNFVYHDKKNIFHVRK